MTAIDDHAPATPTGPAWLSDRDAHRIMAALARSESDLIDRVLELARVRGYSRYAPPMRLVWQTAIAGVTSSIVAAIQISHAIPELDPENDPLVDPIGRFGVLEARRHRRRGIGLDHFLGLFKYVRTAYLEHLEHVQLDDVRLALRFVERVFDRIEVAYTHEWTGASFERELRAQQAAARDAVREKVRLWTLVESLPIPAMLVEPTGAIVMLNRAAEPLFRNRHLNGGSVEPWLAELLATAENRDADAPVHQADVVVTTGEGERTYSVVISSMLDVNQQFEAFAIAMLDITERLVTESALRVALVELQVAHNSVVQTQRLEAIGELAAGVAHEINTPIQFVGDNLRFLHTSFADLLGLVEAVEAARADGQLPDPELFEQLATIATEIDLGYVRAEIPLAIEQSLDGVERVAQIVRALKGVAHPDNDVPMATDLNDIVRNVAIITRNEWKYNSTLTTELDEDLPTVTCFAGPLGQVLVNLIVNAVAAITERQRSAPEHLGVIRITTSRHGEHHVRIAVTDNGTGIPDHVLPRIFDPFFTTKQFGQGTGQGLAIAYAVVVKHHGGAIDVQTTQGTGTTFLIDLPIERRRDPEIGAEAGA